MLPGIRINRERMENAAEDRALLATDLAEYLVAKGVPFRDAYDAVGKLVARSAETGIPLDRVSSEERQKLSPLLGDLPPKIFDARASLAKRKAPGAPSPENIVERIKYWQQLLQ